MTVSTVILVTNSFNQIIKLVFQGYNRVFHKLSAVQECQYCKLFLDVPLEMNKKSATLKCHPFDSLTSNLHLLTSFGANKEENWK